MDTLFKFRGSRRTSRMISHALTHHTNQRVILMFSNQSTANHALEMVHHNSRKFGTLDKITHTDRSAKMECGTVLVFKSIEDVRFSWEPLRYEGYPLGNTPILIDHSAWRVKAPDAVYGYHRWDDHSNNPTK